MSRRRPRLPNITGIALHERDLVSAAASPSLCVRDATVGGRNASAGGSDASPMADRLRELKARWQPDDGGGFCVPSVAQHRADALVLLFLGRGIDLVTEAVNHVRGDEATFDDGTPITDNAVCQGLDQSFIRMMVNRAVDPAGFAAKRTIKQPKATLPGSPLSGSARVQTQAVWDPPRPWPCRCDPPRNPGGHIRLWRC